MDDKWIDELRKAASGGGVKAPENLLADIRKTMAERGIEPVRGRAVPERGRFRLLIPLMAAAALACVLTLPLFFRPDARPDSASERFAVVPSDGDGQADLSGIAGERLVADVPVSENRVPEPDRMSAVSGRNLSGHKADGSVIRDARAFQIEEESAEEKGDGVLETAVSGNVAEVETAETAGAEAVRPAAENAEVTEKAPEDDYDAFREPVQVRKKTRGRPSLGASFAGAAGLSGGSGDAGPMMAAEPFGVYSDDLAHAEVNSMPGYTVDIPVPGENHAHPLKFGLSVSYLLSERLSVGSGAVFSYLSSTFESEGGSYTSRTRQRLQFIGVPLTLSCRLAGSGRFSVYVSGTGMAEWLVGGKSVTSNSLVGYSSSSETRRITDGRTYFSAGVSLGAQYRLAGRASVYVEPGVMHHFDNGTRIKSSYTANRTDLDFQIGLRFSL